jgi:osmotically-inducible protein OsmY
MSATVFDSFSDVTEVDRSAHGVERCIQRALSNHPRLCVSNLVVRRVGEGVCLTGVVESIDDETDVCRLVREVAGVDEVLNRLIVRSGSGT